VPYARNRDVKQASTSDPGGWRISKRGDPYLTRAGLTVAIYRRAGGFAWRIAAWNGGSTEADQTYPTIEIAKREALGALPDAKRRLSERRVRR
jgi:hypothetical protein